MKPFIGITCSMGQDIYSMTMTNVPSQFHRMNDTYIRAIENAGGIPVILPSMEDPELIHAMADRLDGFLFSGGVDVDPVHFSQRATAHLGTVCPRRDTSELELARYVIHKTSKPVLGICRGIQVINVAMGGSLIIDLPDAGKPSHSLSMYPRNIPSHDITVAENTRLAAIMGSGKKRVNSFHHQAVDHPAEGFAVSAYSLPDQVVEAMELPGDRFVVGVQWHPEELTAMEESRHLFRAFVQSANSPI